MYEDLNDTARFPDVRLEKPYSGGQSAASSQPEERGGGAFALVSPFLRSIPPRQTTAVSSG